MKKSIICIVLLALLASSCKVFLPSRMLHVSSKDQISAFSHSEQTQEYKIAPNDVLRINVYYQNGEDFLDMFSMADYRTMTASTNPNMGLEFLVEFDGYIKLPYLGYVKIDSMTLREAGLYLEEAYSEYLNNPMVRLQVMNKRVTIFPGGSGGSAKVINLVNNNTTLIEALALAGGINDGKAYKIKLIRGDLKNPTIYQIDLSTVEGLKQADLVLQANDIIYVEPAKVLTQFMKEFNPYLSLANTILIIFQLFR
ncbi:MAG: polysaccharide biosynthesis/export family protein [Bacteroidales bacterium]|nr:polysaccharide biosynthesis/export family protein [Bacteroidales bacterium]MDD3330393.1 polysaccharide biosynthesis/export family protein [Bacteroidales bacterium]MDD3690909.1 polysaccharide biosynthesis/export family protein [Bacteroidales bacterium]MDX9889593.1 polysaccharide biosynthesis/export family protein [Bacteroidales bacterium]